jgi:hypothetical protein
MSHRRLPGAHEGKLLVQKKKNVLFHVKTEKENKETRGDTHELSRV